MSKPDSTPRRWLRRFLVLPETAPSTGEAQRRGASRGAALLSAPTEKGV